jgi:cyclopropane-fatty-acyl-phospholipid synthase
MMYSSAIFEAQDQPLESASLKKLDEICQRLKLNKEDHVLEIGSGWGGFAIHAASHYGCKITTTTISEKQYSYVKAKVQALGLADRIEVINKDYRILEGTYDKLVSIEMIEAIGFKYFDTFFEKCNSLLKDGGSFLLQAITINDQSYSSAKNEIDFIKKYIFPGGCLPSIQTMFDSVARKTSLQLLHARELGQDYALTLEAWRKRFHQKINEVRELGYSDKFIRMWEFYFCYCIAAFRQGYISDFHLLWKKRA